MIASKHHRSELKARSPALKNKNENSKVEEGNGSECGALPPSEFRKNDLGKNNNTERRYTRTVVFRLAVRARDTAGHVVSGRAMQYSNSHAEEFHTNLKVFTGGTRMSAFAPTVKMIISEEETK
jgi:hypothetical protein